MKTLRILEQERLQKENKELSHLLIIYKDITLDIHARNEISKKINLSKRTIGNLTQTVKIEIAKHANLLFDGIEESLKYDEFKNLFYTNFEKYIYKVASLIPLDKKYKAEKQSGYNLDVQKSILFFDFTQEELETLVKKTRDEFIEIINEKYETNIPSQHALQSAYQKWQNSHDDLEQIENAKLLRILQIRNGEFIQVDYPLQYEKEAIQYYNALIEDNKKLTRKIN